MDAARRVPGGVSRICSAAPGLAPSGQAEEVPDLMVDAVHAEILPVGDDRREALRSLAKATRQAAHTHERLADLLGARPQLGPPGQGEAVVAALDGVDVDAVMPVLTAVDAYVIGAVRRETAERATGMDEKRWQASRGRYPERAVTGPGPASRDIP